MKSFPFNRYAARDNHEGLKHVVTTIADTLSGGTVEEPVRLLVYCKAGANRSASVVAAFLAMLLLRRPSPGEYALLVKVCRVIENVPFTISVRDSSSGSPGMVDNMRMRSGDQAPPGDATDCLHWPACQAVHPELFVRESGQQRGHLAAFGCAVAVHPRVGGCLGSGGDSCYLRVWSRSWCSLLCHKWSMWNVYCFTYEWS